MPEDLAPFDPTSPTWRTDAANRKRARAAAGVVPARGDYPGRTWSLAQIGVGWPIYSTERRYAEDDLQPLGGVVVEVLQAGTDPDTGEIIPTRYRVLDTARPAHPWNVLEAPEVDVTHLEGVGRQMSTRAVYWLMRQVKTNRYVLHPDDAELLHHAWALAVAAVAL
jgi:hypothetical protein